MEKVEIYDAVVVGGGPAGLMAARKLAENGVDTILFEKDAELGRKPCAEAISERGLLDAEVQNKTSFVVNEIRGALVHPPDEKRYIEILGGGRFQKGYIIDKPKFLGELADLARSKGAKIKLGARVVDARREGSSIKLAVKEGTRVEEAAGKVVLGCDGYSSLIARKFFDTSKIEYISCAQYSLLNCEIEDEHLLRFYLGSSVAPLGYLWIFPKGNGAANVGVGVRRGSPKPYLDKFIKEHPSMFRSAKPEKFGGAPVIISGQLPKITDDNLMLCGEAAGQVIPLTGAGIHTGIVAGKIAGAVAAEAIKSGNVTEEALLPYKNKFDEIFGASIKRSLKAMRVFERLPDEDLNRLANLLSGEDVIDLANGLNVERVARKLLSHPILAAKVARALLT